MAGSGLPVTPVEPAPEPGPVAQVEAETGTMAAREGSAPQAIISTPDSGKDVENRIAALENESARQRETVANYVNEREALVKRISAAENDLRLSEAQIQRRDKTLEELQKSLNERAPLKMQGEQRAAEMAAGAELKPVSRPPGQFEAGSAAHRETQELCKQLEQELAELRDGRNQHSDGF